MNLYFIRHGNPDYCRDCLTELGQQQAEACAEELLDMNIDEIYSSAKGRAIETARHLADKLGKPVTVEPWANEIEHYAYLSGGRLTQAVQMEAEFLRSPEVEALGEEWYTHPQFNGSEQVRNMVDTIENGAEDFLERQGYRREGHRFKVLQKNEKNIAFFGHAGAFLILAGYLLQMPTLTAWHSFFTYQTGISWINIHNSDSGYTVPRFLYINNTHHLRKNGLPLT